MSDPYFILIPMLIIVGILTNMIAYKKGFKDASREYFICLNLAGLWALYMCILEGLLTSEEVEVTITEKKENKERINFLIESQERIRKKYANK